MHCLAHRRIAGFTFDYGVVGMWVGLSVGLTLVGLFLLNVWRKRIHHLREDPSSISLLEPVVETLEERTPLNRVGATVVAGLATWVLGIGALLSFNLWSDVKLGGLNLFDLLDYATSKFMLPLAGLGAIVFAAWKLEQQSVRRELGLGAGGFRVWTLLARYVAPLGILFVFWHNL